MFGWELEAWGLEDAVPVPAETFEHAWAGGDVALDSATITDPPRM